METEGRPAGLTEHDIRCLGILLRFEGPVVIAAQRVCPHPGLPTLGTLYHPSSSYAISEYAVDRHNAENTRVQALTLILPEPPV